MQRIILIFILLLSFPLNVAAVEPNELLVTLTPQDYAGQPLDSGEFYDNKKILDFGGMQFEFNYRVDNQEKFITFIRMVCAAQDTEMVEILYNKPVTELTEGAIFSQQLKDRKIQIRIEQLGAKTTCNRFPSNKGFSFVNLKIILP